MKLWMLKFLASYEKFLSCAWDDWEYSLVQVFVVAFGWLWVIMDNFDRWDWLHFLYTNVYVLVFAGLRENDFKADG